MKRSVEEIRLSREYKDSLARALSALKTYTHKKFVSQCLKNTTGDYGVSRKAGLKKIVERGSEVIRSIEKEMV